ncbi:glycolate oxidase iron-sulfur subunit [Escherichia coli]|uniref:Glycolate oxidase iron-sulfur subunit n=1 Tax=Escherichia coli TaxID=562 RepID=A0A376MIC7_ECOLX|nr:glycolate oxidase iron-sulfur subunit [Escherichia coli]
MARWTIILMRKRKGWRGPRNNIDAWWPAIEAGAEAILQTASGCGAFVKEYGQMLKSDALYADKARRVSELAVDLVELLRKEPLEKLAIRGDKKLAFHCPCTLQHAQKLNGEVEKVVTSSWIYLNGRSRQPSVLRFSGNICVNASRSGTPAAG